MRSLYNVKTKQYTNNVGDSPVASSSSIQLSGLLRDGHATEVVPMMRAHELLGGSGVLVWRQKDSPGSAHGTEESKYPATNV